MFSFVLHLYQPFYQEKDVFESIFAESYGPLLKLIKSRKDFNVTINVPFSLLEKMVEYNHTDWISELKALVESGRVELMGTGAFHPILPALSTFWIEKQILFQEAGLGYFFGRDRDFEGDSALMVKNLNGFFPPELALNNDLLHTLSNLNYAYVLADDVIIEDNSGLSRTNSHVLKVKDFDTEIITRNSVLSNSIAFKRDDSLVGICFEDNMNSVIALDGETFGHHNKQGISLLNTILDHLKHINIPTVTLKKFKDEIEVPVMLDSLLESSWGAKVAKGRHSNPLFLWKDKDNYIHNTQWYICNFMSEAYENYFTFNTMLQDFENINELLKYVIESNTVTKDNKVCQDMLLINMLRLQNSDQFWWASGHKMPDNKILLDKKMLKKALNSYKVVINENTPFDIPVELRSAIVDLNKFISENL